MKCKDRELASFIYFRKDLKFTENFPLYNAKKNLVSLSSLNIHSTWIVADIGQLEQTQHARGLQTQSSHVWPISTSDKRLIFLKCIEKANINCYLLVSSYCLIIDQLIETLMIDHLIKFKKVNAVITATDVMTACITWHLILQQLTKWLQRIITQIPRCLSICRLSITSKYSQFKGQRYS